MPPGSSNDFFFDRIEKGIEQNRSGPGGPLNSTVIRLQGKFAAKRAELDVFIASLPPEMIPGPRRCVGKKCEGYRWVWFGHPTLDDPNSKFIRKPCTCYKGQRIAEIEANEAQQQELLENRRRRFEESGIPAHGPAASFDLASFALTKNGGQKWFGTVKLWLADWPALPQGLVLSGKFGRGKSGVALSVAKFLLLQKGANVNFIVLADFEEKISRAWARRKGNEADLSDYALTDKLREADLLLLDDVGAGHRSVAEGEERSPLRYLYSVIDYRYRRGKPFIITTNCEEPGQLGAVLGERNLQRIMDSCAWLLCDGDNLRGVGK